jgi:hypothetical protein
MLTVEELIGNLLLRHNCVIVPSFGGFVAKQTSATIDYKNGVMLPPRKSILFNRQLINNDGLLISEYATTNHLFYNSAEESVKNSVSVWNEKLRNGERITLDRVGYLFYDQEKNICFEQDRFFNLLLESYGLGKVHFVSESDIQIVKDIAEIKPLFREEDPQLVPFQLVSIPTQESPKIEEKSTISKDHPSLKAPSKVWKYVAAALLIPIGFYSFWIPMKTNVLESGVLSFSDFNPTYKSVGGSYQKEKNPAIKFETQTEKSIEELINAIPSDVSVYSYSFDGLPIHVRIQEDAVIAPDDVAQIVVPEISERVPEKVMKKPIEKSISKKGSFDYIVGSFSVEENAKAVIAALKGKGMNACQIKEKGLFKVSAGTAVSATEINLIAEKSKSNGFTGWILKR